MTNIFRRGKISHKLQQNIIEKQLFCVRKKIELIMKIIADTFPVSANQVID